MRTIEIYDTTLRDGSQGEGVNFSLEDKLAIARRLTEAGVDFIEGGYPLSNPKDAQFFEQVRALDLGQTRVAAGREVFYDAEHFFDGWKLDPAYAAATLLTAARARESKAPLARHVTDCLGETHGPGG
jgi:hypothetical protein